MLFWAGNRDARYGIPIVAPSSRKTLKMGWAVPAFHILAEGYSELYRGRAQKSHICQGPSWRLLAGCKRMGAKVVWSLSLQNDSEGPTLIDYIVTQNESSVADSLCSWRTQK
jgi:hypothetical protein